jgi:hypothetical protein
MAANARLASKPKILRYPLNKLDDGDDYLKIDVIRYVAPGLDTIAPQSFSLISTDQTLAKNKQSSLQTIVLPIPEGISDTNNADWGASQMGPIEAAVSGAANDVVSGGGNPIEATINAVTNLGGAGLSAASDAIGQKNLSAALSSAAAKSLLGGGANINQVIGRATGSTLNPNSELLFNSVTQRDFNFSFNFIPRSKEESDIVKYIIRTFKIYMAASKGASGSSGGAAFIAAPEVFQLTYMNGSRKHPFLNTFKPMALTGMSVNYTGSGTYATYADATPIHMSLSLSFKELTPIYKEDYEIGDAVIGVGY